MQEIMVALVVEKVVAVIQVLVQEQLDKETMVEITATGVGPPYTPTQVEVVEALEL